MLDFVRSTGERLADDDLEGSDMILPPSDISLAEARQRPRFRMVTAAAAGVSYPSAIYDLTKRRSITGPCEIGWRDGMRDLVETLYPGALQ